MARKFAELTKDWTPERKQRVKAAKEEMVREVVLGELREMLHLTQTELADRLHIKQASVSKLEHQEDMQIETLRKIVEALGGKLELRARFADTVVSLDGQFGR